MCGHVPEDSARTSQTPKAGEIVYQCREADAEIADLHQVLGLSGGALVCHTKVKVAGETLVACIDTGATFSLLAKTTYDGLRSKLPDLGPPTVFLEGAGGDSLEVAGTVNIDLQLGNENYRQLVQVGRLAGVDLLLGMDWLSTYDVVVDCASRTIKIGVQRVAFGQALTVSSGDLVRLTKTVRIRPRGVQRVMCQVTDLTRVGEEVLVEGTAQLGGELFIIPSLEVIRDDGSLPLTLENQGVFYQEVAEGLVVAKITNLGAKDATKASSSLTGNTSAGESTPPATRIWHLPAHVASVQAASTKHGKEWTSRQLIPEERVLESPERSGDCVYFAEAKVPVRLSTEPIPAGERVAVPDYLRVMFPPEGTLSRKETSQLESLVLEYEDIFVGPDDVAGFTDLITHKINTGDAKPIKQNYFRRSMKEREYIDAELEKMIANGVIRPSKSPWGAPVVLVRKKSGELRFCIDFRLLNEVTKKDAYPLPKIDECLDALEGSRFFSTLDLASGYWQVAMDPEDAEKTAFVTHRGLYQWTVMPFGLCNAPATFCRLMEMVLADIVWSKCLVYLDDILAFGQDFAKASANLRAVFERLRRANLKLKPSKCNLFATSVEYLGHEVDKDGIRPSRAKVQALHSWATPKNLSEVRTYLGFTGYYRRFVPNYSELAKPLTELTMKGVTFRWGKDQQAAFEEIKDCIQKLPLLYYPLPEKDFHLKVDASLYAIGGTLEQQHGNTFVPLGFASKTLCKSRQAYCATKRELYAVVFFMRYFRDITRGSMVLIWTDHAALTWIKDFRQSDNMYIRWCTELSLYKPWKIHHVAGKLNEVADSLSRKREGRLDQEEAFNSRKPCKLGGCPDCEFFNKKLQKCRNEDSDDSEGTPETAEIPIDVALTAVAKTAEFRWEFCGRDEDSDLEEEPELLDGVDFNYYLTRRLHEQSQTTPPDWREAASDVAIARDSVYVAREQTSLRRSRRLAEKRRGASTVSLPLVENETPDETIAENDDEEEPVPTLPLPEAEERCSKVLEGFTDKEWNEAQRRDQCLGRVIELKERWRDEIPREEVQKESREVQLYCRWWSDLYSTDEGVWKLDKTIEAKGRPVERLQVKLVPLAWRESVWRCVHVNSAAHLGYERVYELLRRRFAWPGMCEDVRMMCRACLTCQHCKTGPGGSTAPMKHEYVGFPHDRVGIDLQGPLPETTAGNKYICVIQDYFSKRMELYALKHKTAEAVVDVLFREYISRHGAMHRLHSDQGPEFDNALCAELCKMFDIYKTRTTAYAPWSNGMVERSNKTIKAILRALNALEKDNWDELLPYVYMAYNATPHASTGFSPQRLFYSQCADPLLPVDLMYGADSRTEPQCYSSYAFLQRNQAIIAAETVREVTGRAVEVQIAQQGKKASTRKYRVGEHVMLYSPPNARDKLHSEPWTGPHQVVEVMNDHTVKIRIFREPDLGAPGRARRIELKKRRGRKPLDLQLVNVGRLKPVFKAGRGAVLTIQDASGPSDLLESRHDKFLGYWSKID